VVGVVIEHLSLTLPVWTDINSTVFVLLAGRADPSMSTCLRSALATRIPLA
jgi:hypothetical protein